MLLKEELGVSIQHKVLILKMLGLIRLNGVHWLLLMLGGGARWFYLQPAGVCALRSLVGVES